ncbi:hypothetical protein C0995_005275 [Termitomyces sp. Mi166|nr:hypothetical protein C0995_005275 [Termitomyces sp. Mi166\
MTRLLDLPLEILFRILPFLDLSDLISVSLTHSHLHNLIKTSPSLQFRLAAHVAGVKANSFTNHVPVERLTALKRLEQGWLNLDIDFRRTIPVQHHASGDQVKWSKVKVGRQIVDFGLAIHEHDLIAVLTLSPHAQYPDCCIVELYLLQFSTGDFHPLARSPVLFVEASDWSHPAILIEIVGDHLVLVLTHAFLQFQPLLSDRLYVYQWKTGTLKLAVYLPCQTYHGVLFLSPTILCLPNKRMNTLDIWLIPDMPVVRPNEPLPPLKPFLSIGLPNISYTHALITSLCRAEPNPTPSGTPHSTQPFHPISEDSIVIFSFRGVHRSTMRLDTFTMFVHRSSLLNLILAKKPDCSPDAILAFRMVVLVPWDQWGPTMTRIFEATNVSLAWITTTAGQRCAVNLTQSEEEEAAEQTVTVLDFNPCTVKKLSKEAVEMEDPSRTVTLNESVIEHEMFEAPVKTSLPYVSRTFTLKNDSNVPFKGVLLDEERLLGIKVRIFSSLRSA